MDRRIEDLVDHLETKAPGGPSLKGRRVLPGEIPTRTSETTWVENPVAVEDRKFLEALNRDV